jgi:hypothetical protein
MFETEDLDAREYDWEDELAAREESTTPTETTPTPVSPAAGAPSTSLASGGRKVWSYGSYLWKIIHSSTAPPPQRQALPPWSWRAPQGQGQEVPQAPRTSFE